MNTHLGNTRRQLGELAAMSAQAEAMERRIMERAQQQLAIVERGINAARSESMHGGKAKQDRYMDLVLEKGRLEQVISHARAVLDT